MSRTVEDTELRAYRNLIGSKEYHRQYTQLYNGTRTNTRHSGLSYTNDTAKLKAIKDKYKNGVSDNVINEMVGIKC